MCVLLILLVFCSLAKVFADIDTVLKLMFILYYLIMVDVVSINWL